MKQTFILGAGFSKALFPEMPTMWQLTQEVVDWNELPIEQERYEGFSEDIEQFLTFLYQEMPWKTPEEFYLDRAAFLMVSRRIGDSIARSERRGFENNVPSWGFDLIDYFHKTRSSVASLNYDTIVEMFAKSDSSHHPRLYEDSLYRLPISAVGQRTQSLVGGSAVETFRLLKLHGSTNWYSSGGTGEQFSQVYYSPVGGMKPVYETGEEVRKKENEYVRTIDGEGGITFAPRGKVPIGVVPNFRDDDELSQVNTLDLSPLIIPPVADKSAFYTTRLVKVLWNEFRKAIEQADEIYCVGYSLPKTDLTMRLFLQSIPDVGKKKVFLVNRASKDRAALIENYRDVFRGCDLREDYLGIDDAVEKMVADLCSSL